MIIICNNVYCVYICMCIIMNTTWSSMCAHSLIAQGSAQSQMFLDQKAHLVNYRASENHCMQVVEEAKRDNFSQCDRAASCVSTLATHRYQSKKTAIKNLCGRIYRNQNTMKGEDSELQSQDAQFHS